MAKSKNSDRVATRHRGISYRILKDGSKSYSVYWRGSYVKVDGGEAEARLAQAELRAADARGNRSVTLRPAEEPEPVTFGVLSAEWMAAHQRLRPYSRQAYQAALDNELIPKFGTRDVTSISREDVRALVTELHGRGLASSTVTSCPSCPCPARCRRRWPEG